MPVSCVITGSDLGAGHGHAGAAIALQWCMADTPVNAQRCSQALRCFFAGLASGQRSMGRNLRGRKMKKGPKALFHASHQDQSL
jgi:hypothetical protein